MAAVFEPADDRINDPVTGVANCARSGGPGANHAYRVEINLPLERAGPHFTSSFSADRFVEGRCGWHFSTLNALIQKAGEAFPTTVSIVHGPVTPIVPGIADPKPYKIDAWCYEVAAAGGLDCSYAAWNEKTPLQYIPAKKRGNQEIGVLRVDTTSIQVDIHDLDAEAAAYRKNGETGANNPDASPTR